MLVTLDKHVSMIYDVVSLWYNFRLDSYLQNDFNNMSAILK